MFAQNGSNHHAIFRENELEKIPSSDPVPKTPKFQSTRFTNTTSELRPEDFPQPKYPLGTQVLVTAPDASGVPFVSLRRVVGVFLNPNLPNLEPFKCLGWLYLTEHEDEHEGRYQALAKEVDLSLPTPLEDLPSALEGIVGDLERLHGSSNIWIKQSIDLPEKIDELQDSVRAFIEEVETLRDHTSKTN